MLTILPKVYDNISEAFDVIGEGKLMHPLVPVSPYLSGYQSAWLIPIQGSSDRERLSAHSEVIVLQQRLGISYKDAAHRLYMAELEGVKKENKMHKAFQTLERATKKTLEMAFKTISAFEEDQT
jgi:hypothetical protein